MKPSDKWTISLCTHHHREQHQIGERAFEAKYSIDLLMLAAEFARRSPHRFKLLSQEEKSELAPATGLRRTSSRV